MFHKAAPKQADDSLIQKVNQDLIVHNMPDKKRLAGNGFLEKSAVSTGFQATSPKNNTKTIGLFIIGGGLIVIGVLVYFSYRFIIKPAATNNDAAVVKTSSAPAPVQATDTVPVAASSEVINISTTTQITTSSAISLENAATSSLATSSLDALNGSTTEQIIPLIDSDNDGLYDEEEAALGTDPNSADSDKDGYSDKTELDGGYNPNGNGLLEADPALTKYFNKAANYSILYPKSWTLREIALDNTVIFSALDESIIQVSVSDNSSKLGIEAWYADAFPSAPLTADKLKKAATWDGVISADNLNFYLTDKKHQKIYIISYIPIYANRLAYPNLFKALINSIVLK